MTDEKTRQLENRIDTLESKIEKMLPSRRDALKMGGAALAGGSLMAGTASAGTNQVGTIGSASQPVDLESEDINNADTVTTQDLVVNGTATGQFGGGIIFEEGDTINKRHGGGITVPQESFFTIFDLSSAVDVYGGSIYGTSAERIRITFASNNSIIVGDTQEDNFGFDAQDDIFTVHPIFPMKDVKKLEGFNGTNERSYGFQVFTT